MGASLLLGRFRCAGRLALTAAEFESLLRVLDPSGNRAAAGDRYESIRRRLLILFSARHSAADTAALADETLDRVARRLHGGAPLETSVESYVLGVARNVAREQWKGAKIVELKPEWHAAQAAPLTEPDPAADCLDLCLGQLQPRPRDWVMRFYTDTGGAKIASRKRLASELGLDLNALRVRLFRIRSKLEECMRSCLQDRTGAGNDSGKETIP